jgi:hypothetical protein
VDRALRMSALSPRQMWRLDEACRPIRQTFHVAPYLVGTALTERSYRDVDVRLILEDEPYDALAKQLGPDGMAFLGVAFGEYLAVRTGLPVDFQLQRQTEANEYHSGPRNPLGVRTLANYAGDASPVVGYTANSQADTANSQPHTANSQ